jgi:hypothetical protein
MTKLITDILKCVKERKYLTKKDQRVKQEEILWPISDSLEKVLFSPLTFLFLSLQFLSAL